MVGRHGFIFRGEDVAGQMLFVMGDFEKERAHIISMQSNGMGQNGITISIFGII